MTTKILGNQITSYTIDTEQLSNTATAAFAKTLAPKILYANVASNTYSVLDDTAVNVGGGFIVITGAEFQSGATVLIDTTLASSVTYVNSTTLRAQIPAKSAASYNLYVVNPDGGTGIKPAGITYSSEPSWVTASPLDNQLANTAFGVNLSATGATSYSVAAGSTLPAGTTLAANGYFSGTVSIVTQTTYSFNVVATDAENQDSSKTFQVTVTVDPADPYFNYTTLLLQADDVSNNATNSSFVDSSNNSLTVTPSGTPIQGSFNPFGSNAIAYSANTDTGSTFFNGSTDYLTITNNANLQLGSGNWTLEGWIYPNSSAQQTIAYINGNIGSYAAIRLDINGGGTRPLQLLSSNDGSNWAINYNAGSLQLNAWNHFALVRSGSTFLMFINGTQVGTTQSMTGTLYGGTTHTIGCHISSSATTFFSGYLSNVKLTKGTALYSTTFTPSTTSLTAGVGTELLLLSKNAGIYDATQQNNIQISGDARVRTDVFKYGTGSMYFDSSGDYLTVPHNNNINLNTGDFTIEAWVYFNSIINASAILYKGPLSGNYYGSYLIYISSGGAIDFYTSSSGSDWTGISPIRFTSNASTGAWHHLAITRSGNTFRTFFNGVLNQQATSSANLGSQTDPLYIGVYSGGTLNGYIDDLRITKGYARYTANFTPPTAVLPKK
jgi:hypothetical protein